MKSIYIFFAALFAVSVVSTGCDRNSYKITSVSGIVTFDGKVEADIFLYFQPIGEDNPGPGSVGKTDANGHYSLNLATPGRDVSGAVVGRHRVIIQSGVSTVRLPGNVSEIKTEFEVPPQGTDQANFDLPLNERNVKLQP